FNAFTLFHILPICTIIPFSLHVAHLYTYIFHKKTYETIRFFASFLLLKYKNGFNSAIKIAVIINTAPKIIRPDNTSCKMRTDIIVPNNASVDNIIAARVAVVY